MAAEPVDDMGMRGNVIPGAVGPAIPCRRPRRPPSTIVVRRRAGGGGLLAFAGMVEPCALGRSGIRRPKREGDGGTPAGRMELVAALFRDDRGKRPATALPLRATRATDGWCDAPLHPLYNRHVRMPFAASHEDMRRNDGLYDVVVVLDFNLSRRRAEGGSAIFLHCTRPGAGPGGFATTAGCIALPLPRLLALLGRIARRARIVVA